MSRMSVVDASFFMLETPDRPMHVAPLIVLIPPPKYHGSFADDLFNRLLERPIGPPFNYVARMPKSGLLGRWDEMPSVKPEDHVFRVTAPHDKTIEEYACELYEDLLDISKPLWQAYVIDKPGDPSVYFFCKLHHALLDGIGMVNLFARSFRLDPKDHTVVAPWEGRRKEEHKEAAEHVSMVDTGFDMLGKATQQATSVMSSAMTAYKMFLEQYLGTMGFLKLERGLANPFHPPYGYFNVVPERGRVFSHCSLSLPRMKTVAKYCAVSVNDIFMTVVDAAVSRLLTESKVLMDRPLIAEMMMATQGNGASNNCAPVNVPLGLPNTNPLQRLMEIKLHTSVLKTTVKNLTTDTMLMYSMPLHLAPVIVEKLKLQHTPVMTDIFVSNPYGMQNLSYMMGALVESTLPLSAIPPGHAMNITAVSNVDSFHIGVAALKSAFPHLDRLTGYMEDVFEELVAESGVERTPVEQTIEFIEKPVVTAKGTKSISKPSKKKPIVMSQTAHHPIAPPRKKSVKGAGVASTKRVARTTKKAGSQGRAATVAAD